MNNNINWVGNKVMDAGTSHQKARSTYKMPLDSSTNYMPSVPAMPQDGAGYTEPAMTQQGPPPTTERGYIPYYLEKNLGKNVRAEFIVGSNQYTDRTGKLVEVGINYFVLEDVNSRTYVMCDLYSVKFMTVLMP